MSRRVFRTASVFLATTLATSASAQFPGQESAFPDLDCMGLQKVLEYMKMGPDEIHFEIEINAREFVTRSIPGWRCAPQPLDMLKNSRIYLESIVCARQSDKSGASNYASSVGRHYQQQLQTFYSCFAEQTLTEAPSQFNGDSETSETMILVLKERYGNSPIQVEFGYTTPANGPVTFWTVEYFYGPPS